MLGEGMPESDQTSSQGLPRQLTESSKSDEAVDANITEDGDDAKPNPKRRQVLEFCESFIAPKERERSGVQREIVRLNNGSGPGRRENPSDGHVTVNGKNEWILAAGLI